MTGALPDIAIVVPTYWTGPGGEPRPGDAVYDHPTPVDEEGTLRRLLASLARLDTSRFYVVVLVAVSRPEVAEKAHRVVSEILGAMSRVKSICISRRRLDLLVERISEPLASALLGLEGYSRVRNVQLAVPLAFGSKVIIALDDDEVVTDPLFLERAVDGLGSIRDGRHVEGIGGYYDQDESGRILLEVASDSIHATNIFDRKAAIMNAATDRLEALPDRIVPSPFCFGGNMVFSSELAASVCFDPAITRGEDIDYLINARLRDKWFFVNRDLRVLHLPPAGGSYQDIGYHKVVQDVLRFVYGARKLACWREIGAEVEVKALDLWPYPGEFLGTRLERDAREVIGRILATAPEEERESLGLEPTVDGFMATAQRRAREGVESYRGAQAGWNAISGQLMGSNDLHALVSGWLLDDSGDVTGRGPV